MNGLEALAITGAGAVAGAVNAVVGSGSLVTFPTLVALGYPSVTANVSNTVGLVPGSISGAIGYRRELRGQWRRCAILGAGTATGALLGGVLLLELPSSVFDAVVPVLILLACALMAIRPAPRVEGVGRDRIVLGVVAALLTGIYGGYFGAAQGIILLAVLRLCFDDDLQRLNGVKNVLAGLANGVAAVYFIAVADVAWGAALLIAGGSIVGAQLGARYGRRLPQESLRRVVIVAGVIVAGILAARALR
jgi:uncharacterized membrane protein YfcA